MSKFVITQKHCYTQTRKMNWKNQIEENVDKILIMSN